jgi:hypothetical protein
MNMWVFFLGGGGGRVLGGGALVQMVAAPSSDLWRTCSASSRMWGLLNQRVDGQHNQPPPEPQGVAVACVGKIPFLTPCTLPDPLCSS